MSLRNGVNSVLRQGQGEEVVDEYVIDYVTALLESTTLEECQREDIEALEEGLRGLVENVIAKDDERAVDGVVEGLVNLLRVVDDSAQGEDGSDREEEGGGGEEEEEQETQGGTVEMEQSTCVLGHDECEECDDDVSMLQSLLGLEGKALDGEFQRRYIKRVLLSCSNDVHQAAEKLLEMQSTGELEIELNIERKGGVVRAGPPSPLLDDALKATIVSKYHLQAVPSHPVANRKLKLPVEEEGKKPQIRFRDGAVVSTKGEKYVVEKTLPEWDGGSRGRVKMKGKRGTGWV